MACPTFVAARMLAIDEARDSLEASHALGDYPLPEVAKVIVAKAKEVWAQGK